MHSSRSWWIVFQEFNMEKFFVIVLFMLCGAGVIECRHNTPSPSEINYRGFNLSNNSYIDLSQLTERDMPGTVIECRTDALGCCSPTSGGGGDDDDDDDDESDETDSSSSVSLRAVWLDPSGAEIQRTVNEQAIYAQYGAQNISLRIQNFEILSGIYTCVITNQRTYYETASVGIYLSDEGAITVRPVTLTVDSDLNGASPQFTLTCISTGGPATTVTWTRDSITVTEGTETVLDDPVTAQYTHTLTVTGRLAGLYTCTVANNKPSSDSALYHVKATSTPSGLKLCQYSPQTILVQWTPPLTPHNTIGYQIDYAQSTAARFSSVAFEIILNKGGMNWFLLKNLSEGYSYNVRVRALSEQLPSQYTLESTINLTSDMCSRVEELCDDVRSYYNEICPKNRVPPTSTPNSLLPTSVPNGTLSESSNSSETCHCDGGTSYGGVTGVIVVVISVFLVGVTTGGVVGGTLIVLCVRSKKPRMIQQRQCAPKLTENKSYDHSLKHASNRATCGTFQPNKRNGRIMCSGDRVYEDDPPMVVNRAYQHSLSRESSMEELNVNGTLLHMNTAYRSMAGGQSMSGTGGGGGTLSVARGSAKGETEISSSVERRSGQGSLLKAIKSLKSTRVRDCDGTNPRRNGNSDSQPTYNQIYRKAKRSRVIDGASDEDVDLCANVAYKEPMYTDHVSSDLPYYSYPSRM